ncbi:MAG: MMPL family transporter, partial [Azospirillaceae bacterium]
MPAPDPASSPTADTRPDGPVARAAARLVGLARARPLVTLALALALTAAAVLHAAATLEIRTSTTDMIDGDVPFRRNAVAFDQAFPRLDETIVAVVDAGDGPAAGRAADALAARLADAEAVRDVYVPFSGPFFARNGLLYLDEDALAGLVDTLATAQPFLGPLAQDESLRGLFDLLTTLAEARARDPDALPGDADTLVAVLDRLAAVIGARAGGEAARVDWRALIGGTAAGTDGPGGPRRIVVVEPDLASGAVVPGKAAIAAVQTAAASVEEDGAGVTIRLTGEPVLEQAELRTVARGAGTAGMLSVLLVAAILVVGLRSARAVAGVLVALVCGLIWTGGFAALSIGHLNLISVAFAVPFVGLSVDFGIHFALRAAEHRREGRAVPESLDRAARGVGPSLALAAVCATIGFLAFVPTDYRGLAELGIIAGAGMLVALFAALTVLPAILSLWPGRVGRAARGRGTAIPLPGGRALAALPVRAPRAVLAVAAV